MASDWMGEWWAPRDQAWESDKHTFPSWVELRATGQKGAPDVFFRAEMRDGVPDVVDFRITAKSSGRPVRTADLAAWQPLELMAFDAFQRHAEPLDVEERQRRQREEQGALSLGPRSEAEAIEIRKSLELSRAKGKGPSRAELEEVAKVYQEASAKPTETVARVLAYSWRTAARRVQQARQAGLLPPSGRSGEAN